MPGEIEGLAEEPLPGTVVAGRFRIEAPLGRGGMATVYRAHDERLARHVALKRVRGSRDGDAGTFATQLEREYHTLRQLSHPNIVTAYDFGLDHGTPYYTMELVPGEDLHQAGKLAWQPACAILRDVASALAVLHSRRLLHRDISTRNVRRAADGRAKLIDFGAMSTMTVSKQLIGTPPYVPPEVVQLQALDARADLYSLGALAYFILTGYHAYHARSLGQLRTLWRSPTLPVREYQPDLPAALDALVTELLQFDRNARPASAAEVIERLSAIAGLPLEEQPAVTRAYLVTPHMVGRNAQLDLLREELRHTLQGVGRAVVVQGRAGSGRSRLLDAAVLEAQLLGAVVLRADAADALAGDLGVARALFKQLLIELPELEDAARTEHRALLAHVVPQWMAHRGRATPAPRTLYGACASWIKLVARTRPLVWAVDDFDAADAASGALIATLAQAAPQSRVLLVLGARADVPPMGALQLILSAARVMTLPPLEPVQTESLVRSVFGHVAHVAPLAGRLHALAGGNPRDTLALCERLVERGRARYEAGSWELPAALDAADIPESFTSILAQRVASLNADARDLAEALCLADPIEHARAHYVRFTGHADPTRCYRAVDALVSAQMLVPLGDRYRFSDPALAEFLQQSLDPDRRRELHDRMATVLARSGDTLGLAHHLLLAGRAAEGAALLCSAATADVYALSSSRRSVDMLDHAVNSAARIGMPHDQQTRLRLKLVGVASLRGDFTRFTDHAWPLLDQLSRESGLSDYLALDHEPDPVRRWELARQSVEQRNARSTDTDRALSIPEAADALGRLYGHISAITGVTQDYEAVARLPSLAPLYPAFPSLELSELGVLFQRVLQTGDFDLAERKSLEMLRHLEPHGERWKLQPAARAFLHGIYQYVQGLMSAARGSSEAIEWCAQLQHEPRYRVHVWRIRMVYELMGGNPSMAAACRRRAELLSLQDLGQLLLPGTTVRNELHANIHAADLLAVKHTVETIRRLSEVYPGWRSTLAYARSHYLRLQGDLAGALAALGPALALTPGHYIDYALVTGTHVTLLSLLDRHDDALQQAAGYRITLERLYGPYTFWCLEAQAAALLRAGQLEHAGRVARRCLELMERGGIHGLVRANAYDTAARVALAQRDEAALVDLIDCCARQYRGGAGNPLFAARLDALARDAEPYGVRIPRPTTLDLRAGGRSQRESAADIAVL